MRIALCLHGLSGGKNSKGRIIQAKNGYKCIKKHILDKYDVDVFMHSWTVASEKQMVEWYKPKKYLFESQIKFPGPKKFNFQGGYYQNMQSLYYSYQKSNQLKKQWEEENNFIYDLVIHCRFDLNIIKIQKDLTTFDPDKIYFIGFVKTKLLDHFWISGSKLMDQFIELYDKIPILEESLNSAKSNNQFLNHDIIYLHAKNEGIDKKLSNLNGIFKGGTFPMRKQNNVKNPIV